MIQLKIKTNFPEVRAALQRNRAEVRAAVVRGIRRAGAVVEADAKLRLTQNRSVAFGVLRASIGSRVDDKALTAWVGPGLAPKASAGLTGKPQSYGFYVEFGRRPGRFPPPIALGLWIRRKLGISDPKELQRATWRIGQAIARRGVKPRPFLGPAVKGSEAMVRAVIASEIDKTIRGLNKQ